MRAKRAGKFTKIVILGLIVYALISIINLQGQIQDAKEAQTQLQEKIEETAQENAAMEYDLDHVDDPDTIEDIARDRLGLAMPGEVIFYDVNN